jgi:hypothetical protein
MVVGAFDSAVYPSGSPTLADAWLGIIQVLWWYEHDLLHVHDAPALWKNKTWRQAAKDAEKYIASALGVPESSVPEMVDRMLGLPRWQGMQRQNPLGNGLRMLVSEVLARWGDQRFNYYEEQNATRWFPGITMHGRSKSPSIDVAITEKPTDNPVAVVSCKWSIRHDRISDPTNECTAYKSAAVQQQNMNLRYFVVTSETDGQRLNKVLEQPCVNGLVHIHASLVDSLRSGPTPIMQAARSATAQTRYIDLVELVQATFTW